MKLNKTDILILTLLQQDASMSVEAIANNVGISKSACWRRIQKFESNGVIQGRYTVLNPQEVDLSLTAYISVRTNQHDDGWYKEFKELAESLVNVLEVYRMSGDLDYLLKAVVSDMASYDVLYKKLVKAKLLDVSAAFVMETLKQTTQLPLKPSLA
ncbi:MAG: Lrp/AsnC family transcriptional regulator [Arenicella sp.]|nr:Lrp/AsnC family transcriptional regulator [Arenicella sp.]